MKQECRLLRIVSALLLFLGITSQPATAAEVVVDRADGDEPGPSSFFLPLLFYTETSDAALGLSYNRSPASSAANLFMAAYGTTNSSYGVILDFDRLRLVKGRWFIDLYGLFSRATDQRFYGDLATPDGEVEAGTNESDPDSFFPGEGWNVLSEAVFNFTLPIGQARDRVVHEYETEDGLLIANPSGGARWNPRRSGRTFLTLAPFYQARTLEITQDNIEKFPPVFGLGIDDTAEHRTNGVRLALEYDNRDYSFSPAHGSLQRVGIDRDFGWFDSTNSWTSIEGEYRKYLSVGRSRHLRQNVFAFRAWTAYSKSMVRTRFPDYTVVTRSPPANMGATLGGPERLRGYPVGRFSDRAAIYYSLEWRVIPVWDPIGKTRIVRPMNWRWWQLVLITEVGRVAPSWTPSTLHEDMKWSAGVGARLMLGQRIFRFSLVASDEATQLWFLLGQSF